MGKSMQPRWTSMKRKLNFGDDFGGTMRGAVGKDGVEVLGVNLKTSMGFTMDSSKMRDARTTPLKINMEHNHGGLEDHFPF